jgi:hypothetical protein
MFESEEGSNGSFVKKRNKNKAGDKNVSNSLSLFNTAFTRDKKAGPDRKKTGLIMH